MRNIRTFTVALLALLSMPSHGVVAALLCEISEHDLEGATDNQATVDFEFWYAMGTSTNRTIGLRRMFEVEQLLYQAVDQDVAWCTGVVNSQVGSSTQRVGMITLTPGLSDEQQETVECPDTVDSLMTTTGALNCVVVRASMRILTRRADVMSFTIMELRFDLEDAMQDGLGQNGEVSDVKFLSYLGDNEDEAFSGGVGGGGGGGGEGGSGGGGIVTASTRDGESPYSDDGNLGLILAVGLPVFFVILGAALFTKKRRVVAAAAYDRERDGVLVGPGDPPESFHFGLYHYLPNGRSYLSTRCSKCFAMRNSGFDFLDDADDDGLSTEASYGEGRMKTIREDEPYGDSISPLSNQVDSSHGLGQKHRGMDVHKCKSVTCDPCDEENPRPTTFVPSPKSCSSDFGKFVSPPYMVDEEEDDDSSIEDLLPGQGEV